jgi:hypothetical protein
MNLLSPAGPMIEILLQIRSARKGSYPSGASSTASTHRPGYLGLRVHAYRAEGPRYRQRVHVGLFTPQDVGRLEVPVDDADGGERLRISTVDDRPAGSERVPLGLAWPATSGAARWTGRCSFVGSVVGAGGFSCAA